MIILAELSMLEIQRLARHKARRLERSIEVMDAQLISVSGWLSASLFAINGGGAIAAVGAFDKLDSPGWSVSLFASGLVFAMLSGVLIQHFLGATGPNAEELLKFWRDAEETGKADGDAFDELVVRLNKGQRLYWTAPAMGWISGLFFLAGGSVLALDQMFPPVLHDASCMRLQKQMLEMTGKSGDARELFDTLKCRWQDPR